MTYSRVPWIDRNHLPTRIFLAILPEKPLPLWRRCLFGLVCGVVVIIVRLVLERALGGTFPFILVFPALTLSAVRAGGLAAMCTAVLSAIYVIAFRPVILTPAALAISITLFGLSTLAIVGIVEVLRAAVQKMRRQEQALIDSETRLKLMVMELEHRVNNSLALIGALVNLTARNSESLTDFRSGFETRLQSMARAQSLLTRSGGQAVDLNQLVHEALGPFLGGDHPLIILETGAPFEAPPRSAMSLSLVLNELATNAIKHGALSRPEGRVGLTWTPGSDRRSVQLQWVETGAVPDAASVKKGFGTELFRIVGRSALQIDRRFTPTGLTCSIVLTRE